MKKRALILSIIGTIFLLPFLGLAQEDRSYQYDKIEVQIQVNKDSTFDITERQTYNYRGEYHQGWRSIPLNKISAITDIQVIDGVTGEPLKKSLRLDKTNPASWGYFATYKENGNQNIEWYYNLKDTTHLWIIKYKVHGGIGFYKDYDEVYWNLFTDYSVPVFSASARVVLPQNDFTIDQETAWLYWQIGPNEPKQKTNQEPQARKMAGGIYEFIIDNPIAPQGIVTIAASWPKGLVDKSAFWWDWFYLNWPYLLSLLIILAFSIYYGVYWYLTERWHKGRGTIIPQYEPPQNLRPAMAELIATENISRRTWPATIIDLAVRGYVKISEEKRWFLRRNYTIKKTEKDQSNNQIEDYEKHFLDNLFDGFDTFSTSKIKLQPSKAKKLAMSMDKLVYDLYRETDRDTKAYEVGLIKKRTLGFNLTGLFVAVIVFLFFVSSLNLRGIFPVIFPIASLGFCYWVLNILIKYNPRLNKAGFILKEEWLGFKMYLEKAEKYRLQNLTPDLFEKYLPYAMIFGIEKKWAKNFDSLNMQAPTWYVSSTTGGSGLIGPATSSGGFSASTFSASFSSSFSSAFSSSGASGSSGGGGGGGAGGGGGGGGGGAS